MAEIKKLYDLVKPFLNWTDAVYLKRIPQSKVTPGQTFVLIKDLNTNLIDYGSNKFNSVDFSFQIQIFYALDFKNDMEQLEFSLIRFLEKNGYLVRTIRGRTQDPDTMQDFQTIILNKRRQINGNIGN